MSRATARGAAQRLLLRVLPSVVVGGVVLVALLVPRGSGEHVIREQESSGETSYTGAGETKTLVNVASAARRDNPITCQGATSIPLTGDLEMVGSVTYDQDHFAIVGPLVQGRVAALRVGVGDAVRAGAVLAEIESAEVGLAQADLLAGSARAEAAVSNRERERELSAQHISSSRERELAEAQAAAEAAAVQAAIERLRAFGLGKAEIDGLLRGRGTGGRVPLRAPIAGTVVQRSVTLGQAVERATDAFVLANLRRLWVLLDLYEKDLGRVHAGQSVELRTEALPGKVFAARVAYIDPLVDAKTRTATVRIELDNDKGALRPGQFVTARILADARGPALGATVVPRRAVAAVEGENLLFVCTNAGYERRLIDVGKVAGEQVEVRRGVQPGEQVVTDGAFLLKSELLR